MQIQEYDSVKLKDGRTGSIIEMLSDDAFLIELDCFFDSKGHFIGKEEDDPILYVKRADITKVS